MAKPIHPKTGYQPNASRTRPWQWLVPLIQSTVGSKATVAVTGLLLTGFLVGHLSGNLLIFAGPEAINAYAEFLKSKGPLLWAARLGLLALFVLHLTLTLRLSWRNRQARPVRYAHEQTVQATWASRNMVPTGLVIGLFAVFHIAHYTLGVVKPAHLSQPAMVDTDSLPTSASGSFTATLRLPGGATREVRIVPPGNDVPYLDLRDAQDRHDVYSMVIYGFRNPIVAGVYLVAMLALLLHLMHGVASAFQSLGLNGPRFHQLLRLVALLVAVGIAGGNIVIVTAVWSGWLDLPVLPTAMMTLHSGV